MDVYYFQNNLPLNVNLNQEQINWSALPVKLQLKQGVLIKKKNPILLPGGGRDRFCSREGARGEKIFVFKPSNDKADRGT